MVGFLDFVTGDVASSLPASLPQDPQNGGDDIASRLKADLQRDFGLSGVQASAFVGNLAHESGGFKSLQEINPTVPGSRGGYGYAQWTGPRRRQFEAWANQSGLDPTSYEANYGFLKHELSNTPEGKVLNNLRQAQDPATATRIVSDEFLRPGIPGMDSRQKWTQRILGGEPIGALNPSITRAAERGRGPAADRPARGSVNVEGMMPQPDMPMPDMSNSNDAGVRALIAQQAGGMGMAGPSMGGLGGLGGFRIPGGGPTVPAQQASAPQGMTGGQSLESLMPFTKPNPLAFFGEPLRENQEAEQKHRAQLEYAKALQQSGLSPQQAVAAAISNNENATRLFLGLKGQERENAFIAQNITGQPQGGATASPQPAGRPMAPATAPAGMPAASPAQPAAAPASSPLGGIDSGNKTVDALFVQRQRQQQEYERWSNIYAQAPGERSQKAAKVQMDAIEKRIGGIDKQIDQYGNTNDIKEYLFDMGQRAKRGEPIVPRSQWDPAQERKTAYGPQSEEVSGLRKEVQQLPSYKNVSQAAPVYNSMMEAAGRDNRAADVNLIYGFAKIMDPGSVVREGEMSIAQAIATLPQQLQASVMSQLKDSGRLTPEVRAAIMQEARGRMTAYQGMFDQDAGMYRGIAQRRGMNEADVIPSFGEFKAFEPKAKGGTGSPAPASTVAPQASYPDGYVEQNRRPDGSSPPLPSGSTRTPSADGWQDIGGGIRIRQKQ